MNTSDCQRTGRSAGLTAGAVCVVLLAFGSRCVADEATAAAHFRERVQPILETHCYACHGFGEHKGGHAFDEFKSDKALVGDIKLWYAVLKNVRAGIMPPRGEERPNDDERRRLFDWIEYDAFGIDPADPDPGRVTLRRLNRVEYRNTIRDLTGVHYETSDEFPADDSGYGFDNVGDALSMSPLLLEKYLQAADAIVAEARKPSAASRGVRWAESWLEVGSENKSAADDAAALKRRARAILARFVRRAYRRPVDDSTVDRLVELAMQTYAASRSDAGKDNVKAKPSDESFEAGIRQAMIAVLASPCFLFRVEDVVASTDPKKHPLIDEHSLASRLSYFLWSTMPDYELSKLADCGQLRANLGQQVARMLKDRRSEALAKNFAGQWLRSRDVNNYQNDFHFPIELGVAMSHETESYFDYIVREDRSVLELIDSNYTFVNNLLAKHYGMDGVNGDQMRRVELPAGSPRGGVVTQAAVLVVTSNPTRTSPVKRGLFILDNILGTPPPPPPASVPRLEEAGAKITDHPPTVREMQEKHRKDPLCHSCHARMDPLGLALENFNFVGAWRDTEQGRPIDATGELLTGEKFDGIRQLKTIIKEQHRLDFYRCLTEKLLTYALGRGLEYYDEHTVDQIVTKLDRDQGKFSTLLTGVIESAPFQKQRRVE